VKVRLALYCVSKLNFLLARCGKRPIILCSKGISRFIYAPRGERGARNTELPLVRIASSKLWVVLVVRNEAETVVWAGRKCTVREDKAKTAMLNIKRERSVIEHIPKNPFPIDMRVQLSLVQMGKLLRLHWMTCELKLDCTWAPNDEAALVVVMKLRCDPLALITADEG